MDLLPSTSASFSPSKAQALHLQNLDLSTITTFLSALYAPQPIPPFERNSETLSYLKQLASQHATAEETSSYILNLQRSVHNSLTASLSSRPSRSSPSTTYDLLLTNLSRDGINALEALSASSLALGGTTTSLPKLAAQALQTTISLHEQQHALQRAQTLAAALAAEQQRVQTVLSRLQQDTGFHTPADMTPESTAEYQRATRRLAPKLAEYRERLAQRERRMTTTSTSVSVESVRAKEEQVRALAAEVYALEEAMRAYEGLPVGDLRMARAEVERRGREVRALEGKLQREFGTLVEDND